MSTVLWAAYVAAVGSLAALAAYVVEPVARTLRWPTRWLWALALLAQLAVTGLALGAPGGTGARLASWFIGAWIVASCVAVAVYLRALRALRRERTEWRVTIAEEMPVWVSREMGPAVVGFVRSIIVAPGWAMALGDRERRLLLRHEGEHVTAWDPTLLLGALAACALAPWSPAAWWALARLRLAIEVDCDRRVLAAEPDVAAYGELLVAVQGRVVPGAAGIAAFAERRLPLEERLEAMTARRPRGAAWRWSARGTIAGALVLAACMAPRPTTMSIAGVADISAEELKVKRNEDGTQTITAKNATITTKPDTLVPFMRATSLLEDSALYAQLEAQVRTLDSVVKSGRATGQLDQLLRRFDGVDERRAWALASGSVRRYVRAPGTKPIRRGEIAFMLIDEDGDVVRDVRDTMSRNVRMTADDAEFARRFPDLAGDPVVTSGMLLLDDSIPVFWWQRETEQVLTERALTQAVERAFGPSGPPPARAVGMVAALDARWNVLDARAVPLESLPASPMSASDRARLLPLLATGEWIDGSVTSSGRFFGLAPRSQVYFWRTKPAAGPATTSPRDAASAASADGGARADAAEARARYEQERANALAFATLREHFRRSDVKQPAAGHMALFVLDEEGTIIRRRDVDIRDSVERVGISPMDLHRHFPDLPPHYRAYNAGVTSDESFDLDSLSAVAWWRVGTPPAPETVANRMALARARDDSIAFAGAYARIADTVAAYSRVHGLARSAEPVTVRVLLAADGRVLGVVHGPLIARASTDSVLARFPNVQDKPTRGGVKKARAEHMLPAESEVVWAQLPPPRVIRVEPRKP